MSSQNNPDNNKVADVSKGIEDIDIEIPVDELLDQEGTSVSISRTVSPPIEAILGKKIPILDKGFIRVIDYMGNDASITQAARISYGDGTKSVQQDTALIDFLMRHKHTSPFEMCEIKLHIKAPIFIARQWLRHRTANVNELSARYSVIKEEFYLPTPEEIKGQSKQNKQSRESSFVEEDKGKIISTIEETCNNSFKAYKNLIDQGLAREISREILPQGAYTEFYWKIDLHNLLHFLELRTKPGAQMEIREYANAILNQIVKVWVPMVYKSFQNHKIGGVHFSRGQLETLKNLLDKQKVEHFIASHESPKGELREFLSLLKSMYE